MVTLQLAAANKWYTPFNKGEVTCDKDFLGATAVCKCDGREFGPGKTGDFAKDAITFDGEPLLGQSFWDFSVTQHGLEVPMNKFKSKLAIVVNVASA